MSTRTLGDRMAMLAVWFQAADTTSSVDERLLANQHLLTIFVGLVALAMVVQAIALAVVAAKAGKAMKDLSARAEDFKLRAIPVIESAMEIGKIAEGVLRNAAPKVKTITDNLLETSEIVRGSAQRFEKTASDANSRTQRQVARIDGMVTAALTTTAEIAETIQHGIQVPARKIAVLANQTKETFEAVLAKVKSVGARLSPGNR